MKRFFIITTLFAFAIQLCDAQKIIRKSSRHYAEARSLPEKVDPLLSDSWHQYDPPYNDLCPLDSTNTVNCKAGCVATAMAQVMHYWQWPKVGMGSYTYTDEDGCKKTLTANFSEHVYDWQNMLDEYDHVEYTEEQGKAVALLMSDCGISVNMRYGASSSGARVIYQPIALANYFDYSKGMQLYYRDFYSLNEITLMLKRELAAGRPILVSGRSKTLSHAYLIDGYDENDNFHMMLGLPDNDGDCWTYLPFMTPDQPQWNNAANAEGGFNILQSFTTGIVPNGMEGATDVERHNFVFQSISAVKDSLDTTASYDRDHVKITVHDLSNIGWNMHSDSVSIMLLKDGKIERPLYTYNREFLLEEIDDTTYTDTLDIRIPQDISDGAYSIVPMYRDNAENGEKEWREARTCTGTPNYLIASISKDEVTLKSDTANTAYLTLEDAYFPEVYVDGYRADFSVTVKNHNSELCGRFYICAEPAEGEGDVTIWQMQGVSMMPDETHEYTFSLTAFWVSKEGPYRVRILYESNLFADELIELTSPDGIPLEVIKSQRIDFAQAE